jgi:hypothetical protein
MGGIDLRLMIHLRQGYDGQVVDFGFLNEEEETCVAPGFIS